MNTIIEKRTDCISFFSEENCDGMSSLFDWKCQNKAVKDAIITKHLCYINLILIARIASLEIIGMRTCSPSSNINTVYIGIRVHFIPHQHKEFDCS